MSGDFLFGNPASLHQTGKKSRKFINETSDYLFSLFGLNPSICQLYYHSGATEGINTFFKGQASLLFKQNKIGSFFFSSVDHACVIELTDEIKKLGHHVYFFDVNKEGAFDLDKLIKNIKEETALARTPYLNFTYINNETGIIWPLSLALKIKQETAASIHVDAVQLVGKTANWQGLAPELDAYTFSGHKFGAMKGVGFTFLNKSLNFSPLLQGGSQQAGLRAGTENALGIYSIKLALEDMVEYFDADGLKLAKIFIENKMIELLGDQGEIVAINGNFRNLNTIFVVLYGKKADLVSTRFDLQGMDVSTGSACSSGIIKENRVLQNMGYSIVDSTSAIRFSFSPLMTNEEAKIYFEKIKQTLTGLIKIK